MPAIECSRIIVKDPKSSEITVISIEPPVLNVPFPVVSAAKLNGTWLVALSSSIETEMSAQQFDIFWRRVTEKETTPAYHVDVFDGNDGLLIAPEAFSCISLSTVGGTKLMLCDSFGDVRTIPVKEEWADILCRQLAVLGRFVVEVPSG